MKRTINELTASGARDLLSTVVGDIFTPAKTIAELRRRKRIMFLEVAILWVFYLIAVIGLIAASHFLIPLLIGASLLTPIFALTETIIFGIIAKIGLAGLIGVVSGACVSLSLLLASAVYYSPYDFNLVTNFNVFRWSEVFSQIVANAYKNSDPKAKFNGWQLANPVAHTYLIVGGIQFIINKLYHQIYDKRVIFDKQGQYDESNRSGRFSLFIFACLRVVFFVPFLLGQVPMNFFGTLIEQLNFALFHATWYLSNRESYLQKTNPNEYRHLFPDLDGAPSPAELGEQLTLWRVLYTPHNVAGAVAARAHEKRLEDTLVSSSVAPPDLLNIGFQQQAEALHRDRSPPGSARRARVAKAAATPQDPHRKISDTEQISIKVLDSTAPGISGYRPTAASASHSINAGDAYSGDHDLEGGSYGSASDAAALALPSFNIDDGPASGAAAPTPPPDFTTDNGSASNAAASAPARFTIDEEDADSDSEWDDVDDANFGAPPTALQSASYQGAFRR